jgi:hypothetical protein
MDSGTGKPVMEPTYAVYNTKGDVKVTPEATTELAKFVPGFKPPGDGKMKASDY